jgi:hypothetical protein
MGYLHCYLMARYGPSEPLALSSGSFLFWHDSDQQAKGQSMTALPGTSDIDLFGYGKGVVDFDTKIAHRALDLLMS